MTQPAPTRVDLSSFTDEQLSMLLNVAGQMRFLALDELARRHPLPMVPIELPMVPIETAPAD